MSTPPHAPSPVCRLSCPSPQKRAPSPGGPRGLGLPGRWRRSPGHFCGPPEAGTLCGTLERLLPLLLVLTASVAAADTLEVLGPPAVVPAEGFSIALLRRGGSGAPVPLGEASLSAEGAELKALPAPPPLQGWQVLPRPGAREVRVRARAGALQAEARYVLGPPASRVELTVEPAAPVKGRDREAALTVRLLRPEGTPEDGGAPPVLRVNVGRVEGLARTGPGTWRARYVLPDTRYPEVAVLVALSAWPHPQSIHGAYGQALVPLAAAVDLPGRTEPRAEISLSIAGTRFGPVAAGEDGRFRLPVVVPPGHRMAQSRVVDRAGNVRNRPFDLRLPPTDRLACVLQPQRLPADGASRARVLCAASDEYGAPVAQARQTRVEAHARHGTLQGPRRTEGGLLEWLYTAPRHLPAGPEEISASLVERGRNSQERLALELVQGPVAQVALRLAEPVVHLGSTVEAELEVKDALGRPRPGAVVAVSPGVGRPGPWREQGPGVLRGPWQPPEQAEGEVELRVSAFGPVGSEPARLHVWAREGVLYAGVSDLAGWPVPRQPLRVGGEERTTGEDGVVALGLLRPGVVEVAHGQWPGLRQAVHVVAEGGPVYPLGEPLVPAPAVERVRLAPPVPVNVRLQVEGARVTYWVEDERGRVLEGRPVHVALSSGQAGPVEVHGGRSSFTVQAPGPVSLSVADVATGVTALAEVRP